MDYNAQVTEFLSRRENLLFAFEIVERLEDVKDKFQKEFWLGVRDVIRQRLGRSGLAGKWDIDFPHVSKLSVAAWLYCNLFPTTVTNEQYYLGVGLQQNAGGRFVYGVWWCDTLKRKTTLEPVKRLAQKLKSQVLRLKIMIGLANKTLISSQEAKNLCCAWWQANIS